MTRERISFTFDPRDMLLSLQMGFSFVRAAVACAILERTSGLDPSSETTAPRYLKLVTVPNTCPFTFISLWMPLALFVISLVFSALISILYLVNNVFQRKLRLLRLKAIDTGKSLPNLPLLRWQESKSWQVQIKLYISRVLHLGEGSVGWCNDAG